jgi:hypothetical protein
MDNKKFRYNTSNRWFKGNTHIHSTASDGGKTIEELDELYLKAGYDFLFLTDHWERSDFKSYPGKLKLLWLDGVEYDARDSNGSLYHIVLLGSDINVNPTMLPQDVIDEGRKKDAIIILPHPGWSGNSTEDATKYDFDGVEVFNYVAAQTNGKACGDIHLEKMLLKNHKVLTFASDDAHIRETDPFYNGGWIVINSEKCTTKSVRNAIRNGNYYSTTGPDFYDIKITKNNQLKIKTSPVNAIRLLGSEYLCKAEIDFNGKNTISEHTFDIPQDWPYVYIELEDSNGKRAWTNNLFI